MTRTEDYVQIEVTSASALWDWLGENHGQAESVWLVTFKKAVPGKYVSRDEVLDALIAHGWIDGIRRALDETRTMQLISPRKQQAWAQSYKDRAERLTRERRMHTAGLASVAAGRASGLWDFYADVDALIVPRDLAAALEATPGAASAFDGTPDAYRRNVLRWLKNARTEKTRSARIGRIAESAARGERIPQM